MIIPCRSPGYMYVTVMLNVLEIPYAYVALILLHMGIRLFICKS